MSQKIPTTAAVIGILVLIGCVALAIFFSTGGANGSKNGEKPPTMPADATEKLSQISGGATRSNAPNSNQQGNPGAPPSGAPGTGP